jgi:putative membrane protein
MLRPILAASLLATFACLSPATAAQPPSMPVTNPSTFVAKAGASNLFEIQSSQLALTRTTTPVVMFFAHKMVDDHTTAGKGLQAAAKAESISVPTEVDSFQADELAELKKLEGVAFDTAYNAMQLMAHDQAVTLFEGYAKAGKPGPLEDFARKTLPTLEMHQTMIHTITGT